MFDRTAMRSGASNNQGVSRRFFNKRAQPVELVVKPGENT
jgi:hypothetical protein